MEASSFFGRKPFFYELHFSEDFGPVLCGETLQSRIFLEINHYDFSLKQMYHNHIPYLEMEIFQGGGDGRTITSKICYKNIED